jgi:hypothetical protein
MATRRWLGKAKQVTQVNTVTIANTWTQNDTVTITVDGIVFVVTIGTLTTITQVATTLKQAFNGETLTDTSASASPTIAQGGGQAIPQLAEITATAAAAVVTLTANTSGKPFTITVSESTAGDGTATGATPTAATGKWFANNAANWTGGAVPINNEPILFDSGNVDVLYGLSLAIQPTSVTVTKGYTGRIGLHEVNTDSLNKPYAEYRTKYLTFVSNTVTTTYHLFEGSGTGSSLVRIDAGAGKSIFNIYGSGARQIASYPSLLLQGTHVENVVNCVQGDAGLAFFATELIEIDEVRCGNGRPGGAVLVFGAGTTFNTVLIDIVGGDVTLETATAGGDIDISGGGSLTVRGTAAHANIDVQHGTCNYNSSGTLATLALGSRGVFDRSGDLRACTITNLVQLFATSIIRDPNKSLTLSGGFKLNGSELSSNLNFGPDRTYTVT